MAFLLSEGAEPIPGYRLIRRLGTGGYGEVWLSTAPGGLTKAIKVIFGHMRDARAEQELRALNRIKEVRHPFLLSLERYEIIEDQVFIVTEVADGSLMDRFDECRRAGLSGIPRDELLSYMRDTADALDYMNEHYGLQHLDIKPQNLLVVAGRVKIADFGLVKDLYGTSATATGGVTPLYASPEAFDGKVSRFSDQYSLAIVYQEMLTGLRPFPGRTTLQLAAQHMNSPPLLDPLPVEDRPVIGRGLAKVPDQRFPTCREMVSGLLKANGSTPPPMPHRPPAGNGPPRMARTPPKERPAAAIEEERLLAMDTLVASEMPRLAPRPRSSSARLKQCVRPVAPQHFAGDVRLRPTLFVGVGGLAGAALRRLRHRLHRQFGDLAQVPVFRLLLLDTDRGGLWPPQVLGPGDTLGADETMLVPLRRPDHYRSESKELMRWLDRRWLYGIPRSLLTEGMRPFGRLALVDGAPDVLERIRESLELITSEEAESLTGAATQLSLRERTPQVFLIASISGGTGSGMVVDLAYGIRQVLAEMSFPGESCGILLHATSDDPTKRDLARVNAFATLAELNHYSQPGVAYPGDPRHGLNPCPPGTPPLRDAYLLHLGDELTESAAAAATDSLAEYLFLGVATEAAAVFDRRHRDSRDASGIPALRSFGLDRLHFPKRALVEHAADVLCRHLLERWHRSDESHEEGWMKEEAWRQLASAELRAEALANKIYAGVQVHWASDPEEYLQNAVNGVLGGQTPPKSAVGDVAAQVLRKLDELFGAGTNPGQSKTPPPSDFESKVRKMAETLGWERGTAVVDWFIGLVNRPEARFSAAADAVAAVLQELSEAVRLTKSQLGEIQAERVLLRARLLTGESAGKTTSRNPLGIGERKHGNSPTEQRFLAYCWLRLSELLLEATIEALRGASRLLGDFAQELNTARSKLGHLAERFAPDAASSRTLAASGRSAPNLTELLPGGAASAKDAADELVDRQKAALQQALADNAEKELLEPRGGLWASLTGDGAEALAVELRKRARAIALESTKEIDAARLFLHAQADLGELDDAVGKHLQAAAPRLSVASEWQELLLAVPTGPAGQRIREVVIGRAADASVALVPSDVDVVICCEASGLTFAQVAWALIEGESTYADLSRKVMTRIDVSWTPLPTEVLTADR